MSGTSVPARWTKHRPIAYAIAAEYRIPGLERQDVDQEACVALWLASRAYDRSKGSFPAFARLVIHRRLTDLVREATRQKRSAVTVTDVDVAAPNRSEAQLSLFSVLEVAATALTVRERGVVRDHLNGSPSGRRRRTRTPCTAPAGSCCPPLPTGWGPWPSGTVRPSAEEPTTCRNLHRAV